MISEEQRNQIDRHKVAIVFRKKRIARLKRLASGENDEFWKALKEEITLAIDTNEYGIEKIATEESLQSMEKEVMALKSHGGALRAYRGIVANVEFAQTKIDALNTEVEGLSRSLKELQDLDTPNNQKKRRTVV